MAYNEALRQWFESTQRHDMTRSPTRPDLYVEKETQDAWYSLYRAFEASLHGLTPCEVEKCSRNPFAITQVINYHHEKDAEASSFLEPGEEYTYHSERIAHWKRVGKAIVEDDPGIWEEEVCREFGVPWPYEQVTLTREECFNHFAQVLPLVGVCDAVDVREVRRAFMELPMPRDGGDVSVPAGLFKLVINLLRRDEAERGLKSRGEVADLLEGKRDGNNQEAT